MPTDDSPIRADIPTRFFKAPYSSQHPTMTVGFYFPPPHSPCQCRNYLLSPALILLYGLDASKLWPLLLPPPILIPLSDFFLYPILCAPLLSLVPPLALKWRSTLGGSKNPKATRQLEGQYCERQRSPSGRVSRKVRCRTGTRPSRPCWGNN